MDSWEAFFKEKSRRRSRHKRRYRAMKAAVLVLLIGSTATALYLLIAGLPR